MPNKNIMVSLPIEVAEALDYLVEKRLVESRSRVARDGIIYYLTMLENILEAFIELKREGYEDPQGTPKLVAKALDKATDAQSGKMLEDIFTFVGKVFRLDEKEQEELLQYLKRALR